MVNLPGFSRYKVLRRSLSFSHSKEQGGTVQLTQRNTHRLALLLEGSCPRWGIKLSTLGAPVHWVAQSAMEISLESCHIFIWHKYFSLQKVCWRSITISYLGIYSPPFDEQMYCPVHLTLLKRYSFINEKGPQHTEFWRSGMEASDPSAKKRGKRGNGRQRTPNEGQSSQKKRIYFCIKFAHKVICSHICKFRHCYYNLSWRLTDWWSTSCYVAHRAAKVDYSSPYCTSPKR